jgi:hypothetical protein
MVPLVVIRPILEAPCSVNHSAPSGPAVMATGLLLAVGVLKEVTTPSVLRRLIFDEVPSVNQSEPSLALVIPSGALPLASVFSSVMTVPALLAESRTKKDTRAPTNKEIMAKAINRLLRLIKFPRKIHLICEPKRHTYLKHD